MCGDFRYYLTYHECFDPKAEQAVDFGPRSLLSWISKGETWYLKESGGWSFTSDYLVIWGARHLPSMTHGRQLTRWFSSAFVHQDFHHLFFNLLSFCPLSVWLERLYGCWTMGAVFLMSHLCGSLASCLMEEKDSVVSGISGGIFGLMGFYVSDWILNFRAAERPVCQLIIIVLSGVYFIGTILIGDDGISHSSHIGGFIFGFYAPALCIPHLDRRRRMWTLIVVGGLIVISSVACSLWYVYGKIITEFSEAYVTKPPC